MADDENIPNTPAEATETSPADNTRAELIKIILDFTSKCFYPGIIIALIILIQPTLAKVDFGALIDRLQSAKAGQYEFTFTQAQDVGAETAPLNNKVAELERLIATLQSDIGLLQNRVVEAKVSEAEKKIREERENKFQANSKYTALVFHRSESRENGRTVTDALLKAGFKSSDTETNFSELKKIKPTPGLIFITYNSAGEVVLEKIKNILEDLVPESEIRLNPRAINLRRGDVQVLVF